MIQNKVDILGVKVSNLTIEELKKNIIDFAQSKIPKTIMYVNADIINIAQRDKEYKNILNYADIVYPDGYSIIWASKVLGNHIKERMTAADFFYDICRELARRKIKLYLLGSSPGIVEKVRSKLGQISPLLNLCGVYNGYFPRERDGAIINEINNYRPDILVVGMGTLRQEKWIYTNRHHLNVHLCWSVGGLFDFLSGEIKRAPPWVLNHNLEWLFRLIQEPKRLWKRYLIGNPIFIYHVLRWKLKKLFPLPKHRNSL